MSLIGFFWRRVHRSIDWKRAFLGVLIIFISLGCSSSIVRLTGDRTNRPDVFKKPYVILISIDGYRSDYTTIYSPPNLKKFKTEGSSAEALLPVYPSKTFTNHYSIATGLYAENHGIVANRFYDPERKQEYQLSDRKTVEDGTWYGGVPIWLAAEKQGMLAASFFWPGSDADIMGARPSYFFKYEKGIPLKDRISQVEKWLELPDEKRPHFITLYFSDVDSAGHYFGPRSQEVKDAVAKVDQALGDLFNYLNASTLPVNVIILSDHGMEELDPNKVEYVDDYTDLSQARLEGDGPQILIYTKDVSQTGKIYKDLNKEAKHFRVYKREDMPGSFHYSKTPRIGDLILVAQAPYSIGTHDSHFKIEKGNHGYDPDQTPSMRAVFYAKGPQVKEGVVLEPFRNIDVYPFILNLLGLKNLVPIDGDPNVLEPLYRNK